MDHKEMLTSLRSAFQVEAADLLNEVDSSLLQLEANPADGEIIHRVFRAIHTLKGSGAMVGLERLSRFAHRVEEVFEAARDGKVRVTPELTDLALRACDLLRVFLADADSTPDLESGTEQQLVTALKAFVKPETPAAPAVQTAGPAVAASLQRSYRIRYTPDLRMLFSGNDPVVLLTELCALGSAHLTAHADSLPAFEELDAEQCYIWWEIDLLSEASEQAIRDVFVFVANECRLEIQQVIDDRGPGPVRVSSRDFESFYCEAEEHLQAIEDCLLRLDKTAATPSDLAELFRRLHSLKGASALLLGESGNLAPQHPLRFLHQLAHAAEALVEQQRDGNGSAAGQMGNAQVDNTQIGNTLFDVSAAMRRLLECIDENRHADLDPELLRRLGIAISAPKAETPRDPKQIAFVETAGQCLENMRTCFARLQAGEQDAAVGATYQRAIETLGGACQYAGMDKLRAQLREHKAALEAAAVAGDAAGPLEYLVQQLDRTEQLIESARKDASGEKAQKAASEIPMRATDTSTQTIRVDQEKLDRLIRNVSELLVARGALHLLARKLDGAPGVRELSVEAKDASTDISRISEELQDAVMSLRMLPVRTVFQRFSRLVRDLGRSLGKEIEISFHGEDTELDKAMIQEIGDPLVHLVRNAADHGIESPETRAAKGKSRCGQIALRAYNEGSQVVIEVEDDGKGLHSDVLKAKAVERGILSETEAQSMSDEAAYRLIFAPGFSTAEAVTAVSGRGVGMDVVSSNVQKLKGTVGIESRRGLGTKIVIKLPTSLMISKGILTQCGDSEFILPLDSVSVARKITASEIHRYRHHAMIHSSEGACPVLSLRQQLGLGEESKLGKESENEEKCVVLIHASGRRYGLLVDRLVSEEQVVVKPLSGGLENSHDFLGATIMGDGRVVLVLNPAGVVL
jgi:two-component system chemotaxis sensor kinase CheA